MFVASATSAGCGVGSNAAVAACFATSSVLKVVRGWKRMSAGLSSIATSATQGLALSESTGRYVQGRELISKRIAPSAQPALSLLPDLVSITSVAKRVRSMCTPKPLFKMAVASAALKQICLALFASESSLAAASSAFSAAARISADILRSRCPASGPPSSSAGRSSGISKSGTYPSSEAGPSLARVRTYLKSLCMGREHTRCACFVRLRSVERWGTPNA
mmetsp:Transcript_42137/g.103904  ORF Transcript_42137/g.103904 Transcript_42137/m.103904 type:complete len:220 (+) Transcript_42137:776-1435(+)